MPKKYVKYIRKVAVKDLNFITNPYEIRESCNKKN